MKELYKGVDYRVLGTSCIAVFPTVVMFLIHNTNEYYPLLLLIPWFIVVEVCIVKWRVKK